MTPPVADAVLARPGALLGAGARPALVPLPRRPVRAEAASGDRATAIRRDALFRRLLAVADLAAAALALALAIVVIGDDALSLRALAALPAVVLVSKVVGLYDRDEHLLHKSTLDEAPKLFHVATLYALLVWLAESFFLTGHLGKLQVVGVWLLLLGLMLVGRALVRAAAAATTSAERCLVLGDAASAARVQAQLTVRRGLNAEVVGRVALRPRSRELGGPELLGRADELPAVLERHGIERVVIAPSGADSQELLDTIRRVKALGVKVSVLPRLLEVVGSSAEFDDLGGLTLLGLRSHGLSRSSRIVKRTVDVTGAALGLLVLSPLLAALALGVKLGSPGPVLFRQPRVGRYGREFGMLKFRSMVADAEARRAELEALNETDGLFKIADDPRVTRVGRLLRRTNLDELPQLLNVLRGDMSLIGPRPLVPAEDARVEGWDRARLDVTPGMTGFWQILGGARVPLREMVKIDYLYGANWSLWLDLKILLRTVPHVLGGRGL